MARRHILLVGLPGSGKSSAGALLAKELGAPFADLDRVIESRAGRSVAEIFALDGEARFRALEAEIGAELLMAPPAVLAPGGGFLGNAGLRRESLGAACLLYLETSPTVAARRLEGMEIRPLLAGADPVARLAALLGQREAAYLKAEARVTTDALSVAEVAAKLAAIARAKAGW